MKRMLAKIIASLWIYKRSYLLRNLVRKLNSDVFLDSIEIEHGSGCRIYNANFGTEPWLIKFGNAVSVGSGVKFITHDGGLWVVRNMIGNQKLDFFAPIKVGNNVFIGNDAMILPGVEIGDNVVIGAKSLVTKNLASNAVYGGVPARFIKSIEQYFDKQSRCVETRGMNARARRAHICSFIERGV